MSATRTNGARTAHSICERPTRARCPRREASPRDQPRRSADKTCLADSSTSTNPSQHEIELMHPTGSRPQSRCNDEVSEVRVTPPRQSARGISTLTRVPAPGFDSISSAPLTDATRSRIPTSPNPFPGLSRRSRARGSQEAACQARFSCSWGADSRSHAAARFVLVDESAEWSRRCTAVADAAYSPPASEFAVRDRASAAEETSDPDRAHAEFAPSRRGRPSYRRRLVIHALGSAGFVSCGVC
jgi:hypothetical protein